MILLIIIFWLVVIIASAKSLDVLVARRSSHVLKIGKPLRVAVMILLSIVLLLGFWSLMQAAIELAGL